MSAVRSASLAWASALLISGASVAAPPPGQPWTDATRSPDDRAAALLQALTPAERDSLLVARFPMLVKDKPADMVPTAGYIPGVARLGLPAMLETDASLGVANPGGARKGDGATALPSGLATAASWNPEIAYVGGAMIGQEAHRKGLGILLAGGVNLARDPRNGRNFEYLGEDPLLAGILDGEAIRGIQDQHVVSTAKHFALNDQETGRRALDAQIGEAALRESDLLAFQIAIERGKPGSVMCAYNKVNGQDSCASDVLLTRVLRGDWYYPGWVMSDWGTVPNPTASALAGLDQESGTELDKMFTKRTLVESFAAGEVPEARRTEMAQRYLRSLFAVGTLDHPPARAEIDSAANIAVARRAAEEGTVLLANRNDLLPLAAGLRKIAVIGGHADAGVLSGGGSSQVIPVGGEALKGTLPPGAHKWLSVIYQPGAPLAAIAKAAGGAETSFDPGTDPAAAAALAAKADVAIVFATQWMAEEFDAPSLSLPDDQDRLIAAVAAANPRTIVVLETGNPVAMPWLDKVGAVLEAWYPGSGGAEAIAGLLFGTVDPSGHLPITFPASLDQNPRPRIPGSENKPAPYPGAPETPFAVKYDEGSDVGYRWFAAKGLKPLFPFGYGLTYTKFEHRGLALRGGETVTAELEVTNAGKRAGADTVQLYAEMPSRNGGTTRRLVGWSKVALAPGETRHVSIAADRRLLASFDSAAHRWTIPAGSVRLHVAANAGEDGLVGAAALKGATFAP